MDIDSLSSIRNFIAILNHEFRNAQARGKECAVEIWVDSDEPVRSYFNVEVPPKEAVG